MSNSRTTQQLEIAIVGAGPYGLAAATHLRAGGHEVRAFGEPLRFWRTHTPVGMLLRSPLRGSDIGDPASALTLADYGRASTQEVTFPIPVERFVDYGLWFQQRAVADVDRREVCTVEPAASGFRIAVDGETIAARRVIVAAGIGMFAWRPPAFERLPAELVSHSLEYGDLGRLAGRRVTVVGGGQSALESAALLHEAGAEVDVLVREPVVHWLTEGSWKHRVWPVRPLLYSKPDVGPALVSHLVARPRMFRRLRRPRQDRLAKRSIRPAGAGWLVRRLADVPIRLSKQVVDAAPCGDGLVLHLQDGSRQQVDHVVLGTGYRVDLSRYSFLPPALVGSIECVNGYPRLSDAFETTVAGLHVLGAPAAWSFGPLMRFVAGSGFSGRTLARGVRA